MKVYQTNEIKNIALLGNDGSGKTTLTESLLFESGIIKRRGRITAKNTVSDYFPVEQEYGYSVFSTVYHLSLPDASYHHKQSLVHHAHTNLSTDPAPSGS
jgi:translation elongation factor EF-G